MPWNYTAQPVSIFYAGFKRLHEIGCNGRARRGWEYGLLAGAPGCHQHQGIMSSSGFCVRVLEKTGNVCLHILWRANRMEIRI